MQRSSLANTLTCRHSIWETGRLKANGTHYSVGSMRDTNWGPEVGGGRWKEQKRKGESDQEEGGLLGFFTEPTQHQRKAEARGAVKELHKILGTLRTFLNKP